MSVFNKKKCGLLPNHNNTCTMTGGTPNWAKKTPLLLPHKQQWNFPEINREGAEAGGAENAFIINKQERIFSSRFFLFIINKHERLPSRHSFPSVTSFTSFIQERMTGGKGMKDCVDRSRGNTDPHSRTVLSRSNQEQENKYMKTIRSGRSPCNLYSGRLQVVLWNNCFLLKRNKDIDWNSMKNFSLVTFRSPGS